MFTLTEVERNCTGLHSDATKLFIFSAIKIAQLFSVNTTNMSAKAQLHDNKHPMGCQAQLA